MQETEAKSTIEKDHSKVAPTADLVAYLRTFSDIPLTRELYAALERKLQSTAQPEATTRKDKLAPQLEARYKLVDKLLLASGMDQVIELAAGIAPRGLNLASSHPEMKYVELDLPGVIKEKKELITGLGIAPPANLIIVSGNALVREDIKQAVSSFDLSRPVAVVNEGLMRYLTFDEKTVLARNVHDLLERFGGVWITPDISLKSALAREDEAVSGHISSLQQTTGIDINQNVFDDVAHARNFFEGLGFAIEEHSFLDVSDQLVSPARLGMTAEEVTRLNGPCPAFVMKLAV